MKDKQKKHPMILRHVPSDVKKILLHQQGIFKAHCNCQFSLPSTIFKIVRDWNAVKDFPINGIPMSKLVNELPSK